jgi:hypothetical protein
VSWKRKANPNQTPTRDKQQSVKKQEHPQTHEEREVKTLVDRIEKKVSDQKLATPKRNLRVVKCIGQVPAIGDCTFCNRQFKVPLESMKRVADAEWNLDLQFKEHKCKREDASQSSARRGTKNSS